MTAEEAKTTWCPMVRAWQVGGDAIAINCDSENRNPDYAHCTGPDCGLWRRSIEGRDNGECGLIARGTPSTVTQGETP